MSENNCLPECSEFNMVLKLTDELSAMDDKVDNLKEENKDLKNKLDCANMENKLNFDRLWIKNIYIKYLERGGSSDSFSDIWDEYEEEINNSDYSNKYEMFVLMLHEILGVWDYDLKTESEIREDFMYDVGYKEYDDEWRHIDIDDIISHIEDNSNNYYKEIPFDNEGERVWWLVG